MFGKHNIPKNNRETLVEDQEPVDQWQETMADAPSFDEHLAEMSTEAEKQPLEVSMELLDDIGGLSTQLEKMGANSDIVRNPAFSRIVEDSIDFSGMKRTLEVGRNAELQGTELSFNGSIGRGGVDSKLGSAGMRINVNAQGEVEILSGGTTREHFEQLRPFDTLNFDSRTTTLRLIYGGALQKETKEVFINLYDGTSDEDGERNGAIARSLYSELSDYDANGIETYRECRDYSVDKRDGITQNEMSIYDRQAKVIDGRPENFMFKLENSFPHLSHNDEESFTIYSRNPDGKTAHIKGRDKTGRSFEAAEVAINGEHGTDDLYISAAGLQLLASKSAES